MALIDLGDRATETDSLVGDHALLLEVAEVFKTFEKPQLHLNGNHDWAARLAVTSWSWMGSS